MTVNWKIHASAGFAVAAVLGLCAIRTSGQKAAAPGNPATLIQALTNRTLWGPDALTALYSIPALRRAGEKSALILPSTVVAATAFESAAAAQAPAAKLSQLLSQIKPQLNPVAARAWRGAKSPAAVQPSITERFGHDRLTRVVLAGAGLQFLKPRLNIADVSAALGPPEKTERVRLDGPSDIRPVVFTNYIYGDGSIRFMVSNVATNPGEISRILIDAPAAAAALFQEAK